MRDRDFNIIGKRIARIVEHTPDIMSGCDSAKFAIELEDGTYIWAGTDEDKQNVAILLSVNGEDRILGEDL